MGWNYLSIPKLQRCNRWSLAMDKSFRPTLYWACDYLSMLGFKLNHVSKRGPSWCLQSTQYNQTIWFLITAKPQCTYPISLNAPFETEMCTFLFWMAYCGIWGWRTVGFMNLVYCAVAHHMVTPWHETPWVLLALCERNPSATRGYPQRASYAYVWCFLCCYAMLCYANGRKTVGLPIIKEPWRLCDKTATIAPDINCSEQTHFQLDYDCIT